MPDREKSLSESIVSVLSGTSDSKQFKVKKLRKMVLLSLQEDESDKSAKKEFKKAVQKLEKEGSVQLTEEGHIFLKPEKKKRKVEKSEESPLKRAKGDVEDVEVEHTESIPKNKKLPCKGNPSAITRCFVGNLPFSVDETSLGDFLKGMTHVKWITDKETGQFYGSAFVEMDSCESAASAVAKTGQELMGRKIKVNFAPARPGDIWPPQKNRQHNGQGSAQAGGKGIQALKAKPEGCYKLFIGNLSYDIDDDAIKKFFGAIDVEIKAVRWIHHRDSGDFKGVGFVEFWNTDACEKAASLNGKNLLGRPIRIDWSE
jgi:nucleolin